MHHLYKIITLNTLFNRNLLKICFWKIIKFYIKTKLQLFYKILLHNKW